MSPLLRAFVLVLATAAATSCFTAWLLRPAIAEERRGGEEQALLDARRERDELRQRLERLEQRELAAPPLAEQRTPLLDDDALDRAVARWIAEHDAAAALVAAGSDVATAEDAAAPAFADADEAFAALLRDGLDFDERSQLLRRIRAAGLSEAVLEALIEAAEERPHDAALQLVLGEAYLDKVFEVGNTPEAGMWAMKADAAFDQALAADPAHWDARFTKAVSLSNWPPFLGKQNEAIRQFETLVQQQGSSAANPSFADTYLILGNLYQQTGRPDEALRVWRLGAGLFPGRQDLRDQIAAIGF